MIVKMYKTHIACTMDQRDKLLAALRELGVVHLKPVDPSRAQADAPMLTTIDQLGRAVQILEAISPAGNKPDVSPESAAEETLNIERRATELRGRLANLHRQVEQLEVWGDVRLDDFKRLEDKGLHLRFYAVDSSNPPPIDAECVETIRAIDKKTSLVAVVFREPIDYVPQGATVVELPTHDRPTVLAEAQKIDAEIEAGTRRLAELAHLAGDMKTRRMQVQLDAQWVVATRSALDHEHFFAIQGWVPFDRAMSLGAELEAMGITAAIEAMMPDEDETPPTLVRYPRWAMPIKGLFDILGTIPGYREVDLSGFFMLALPLFAAMLISDFGYGLIFALVPLAFYRKLTADPENSPKVNLLIVFGVATMIWGVLSGQYFGITPDVLQEMGGSWAVVGNVMEAVAPIWMRDAAEGRNLLMKISFIIGIIHLTLAHLRRSLFLAPSQQALAEVGWIVFMWGMLGIIWSLFFGRGGEQLMPVNVIFSLLIIGGALVMLFLSPDANPVKRVFKGLANALLPALGTFSDTMSYIRLMAVGLASYYIADSFNSMGADLAEVATWFVAAPVVVIGHVLNMALAMIAIFAHGVRLNMLEFSNNAGVEWAGYPYEPFAAKQIKET